MVIDKDNIKIFLIMLVVGLGIGYAYINSDLNINGTARVDHANWDVHWANIQVKNGSVSGSNVITEPTISDQTSVNLSVILDNPGDYYEFTVDAVNAGSIDAMIDTLDEKINGSSTDPLPDYLGTTMSYADGGYLMPQQELLANTTEKMRVRIEYLTDIEPDQLPTTTETINLSFIITYRQATSEAQPVREYLYRSNTRTVWYGYSPNSFGTYFTTYQGALDYSESNFFLRHRMSDDQVMQTDVGFVYNNNVYYLLGLFSNDPIDHFEENKTFMMNLFGSNNCSLNSGTPSTYTCEVSNNTFIISSDGFVYAGDLNWFCKVLDEDGKSTCDIASNNM